MFINVIIMIDQADRIKSITIGITDMTHSLDALLMFVEAATLGSFSAAARKLNKQQSTVSEAIANLEIDLGVTLFDRSTRRPTLSEHGYALLAHAQQVLDATDRLNRSAQRLAGGLEAQLSFALSDTYQSDVFEKNLEELERRYPDLELECMIAEDEDAVALVQSGRVQLALVAAQQSYPQDIGFETIASQSEIGLYVSKSHALAQHASVSGDMLRATRELRLKTYRDDVRPDQRGIRWSSSSYLILLEMTELGFGWAALPRWIVQRFAAAELMELNAPGWPRRIQVHAIWSRQRGLGQAGNWLRDIFLAHAPSA